MLDENSLDLMRAPLDSFDCEMQGNYTEAEEYKGVGDADLEEIEDEVFDGSQPRFGKWASNYTELEDVTLIRAWKSVSLDEIAGSDQTRARYWQCIKDKYHKLMSVSSPRSLRSL